jgi:hypothetical protein
MTRRAAGMTRRAAGMTRRAAGMTRRAAGMTRRAAGMTRRAAGVSRGAYAAEPAARTHERARSHRDPLEWRVRHAPGSAADADSADAGHTPCEHDTAGACGPDRLAARGVEVEAAVLPARERVGPEAKQPGGRPRHRRGPTRGGSARRTEPWAKCDADEDDGEGGCGHRARR